jgi:hypothetical protein
LFEESSLNFVRQLSSNKEFEGAITPLKEGSFTLLEEYQETEKTSSQGKSLLCYGFSYSPTHSLDDCFLNTYTHKQLLLLESLC